MLQLQVQSSMMIKNGPPGSQGITIFLPTHTVRSDESQVLEKNYNAIGEDILHQAASECAQKMVCKLELGHLLSSLAVDNDDYDCLVTGTTDLIFKWNIALFFVLKVPGGCFLTIVL